MSQIQDDSWRFPMPLMCSAFESGMLDYTLAQMPKDGLGPLRMPRRSIIGAFPMMLVAWQNPI